MPSVGPQENNQRISHSLEAQFPLCSVSWFTNNAKAYLVAWRNGEVSCTEENSSGSISFQPSFLSYSKYLCAESQTINLTGFISVSSHHKVGILPGSSSWMTQKPNWSHFSGFHKARKADWRSNWIQPLSKLMSLTTITLDVCECWDKHQKENGILVMVIGLLDMFLAHRIWFKQQPSGLGKAHT